ncbi:putative aminotransferase, class I/classII, pyridoxal phosphate-dependent transferase, major [Septoria linicola]|nr:putative aminotransferase, class I/classII, pyridoxal phosphate-dependent transferase, major [Septoria linicola]
MPTNNLLSFIRKTLWSDAVDAKVQPEEHIEPSMVHEKAPINLLRGWPSADLLPTELIREAANHCLSDRSIAIPGLSYGPDEGFQPAREAIAAWLTEFHQPAKPVDSERICITGAASQNLGVTLGVYTDPEYTRNVWIVTPAYMLVFRMFEDAGLGSKLRAVPEDEEGIDLEYLRKAMKSSEEQANRQGNTAPRFKPDRKRAKVYKHVIYCVPSFSNPSSRTMSLKRRRELVQLARDFDALVSADDVYDHLQWHADQDSGTDTKLEPLRNAHLPRLVDVDRELDGGTNRPGADGFGNVMSNGTWSKLAGPGLRSGWAESTPKFAYGLGQAGCQRSGGSPSQLTSTYLTRLLQTGQMQDHIKSVLCPAYATRYQILMSAVKEHLLPLGITAPQPDRSVVGGYFVWLGLPEGLRGTELATKLQQDQNLIVAPGKIFEVPGDESAVPCDTNIRLCFAWEEERNLREGVERIAESSRKLLNAKEDGSGDYVVVEKDTADMLQTFR